MAGPSQDLGSAPRLDLAGISTLSQREEELLSLAASGLLDKQIAPEMGVSLNTLRTYWRRIREKVGDGSRSALAVAYVENLAKSPSETDFDPDWEIDLRTRTFRRISDRPLPTVHQASGDIPLDELLSALHPEDEPRVRALIAGLDQSTSTFSYSARMITPSGQVMASAFVRVIRDKAGNPIRLLGRRSPTFNLETEEAVFETPSTHDGWVFEPQTGNLFASDGINRRHGLRNDEVHRLDDYSKLFWPEDFQRMKEVLGRIASKEIKSATYGLRLTDPSAKQKLRVVANGIHDRHGAVLRIIGYQAWVPLDEEIEEPPLPPPVRIGFWAKDLRSGSFMKPDLEFCRIYRVDPNSPTLDRDIRARYLPGDADAAYDFIDEAVTAGETRGSRTFKLGFEDGSTQWIRLEFFIETDSEGFSRINGTVLAFEG